MTTEILTQENLTQINESLEAIQDLEENLKRAEVAGLDVASQRSRLDATRDQLIRIKQAYFPNQ
tara:strand:+ start:854 stop:1045 length:192 start_codon:yes stop_codon:yes gene_type:complete